MSAFDELRRVRLFNGLSQRQLRQLAVLAKEREFRPGATMVKEGTKGGFAFFVVAEGEASVSVDDSEVGRLGPGDYFGELALITEEARTATVTAVTQLGCLVLESWDFRAFARDNADVTWKLLQDIAALLVAERRRNSRAWLSLAVA